MKKVFKLSIIVLSLFLLVGCENKKDNKEVKETNEQISTTSRFKEGRYTQIPTDSGTEGDGYDNYLTLENGKATKYDSYYGITTEGTYTVEENIITVTYTRTYGTTTFGEKYDDPYNAVYTYYVGDNRITLDKMSDFDLYESGSVVYELK
jgi:uncharacterized lipoprotein NlpE involved in copper resistance